WLSNAFFNVLLPICILVGIIVFAFGAVGLYEDREWLSLDLALALGGLLLASLSGIVLIKAPAKPESEESPGYSVGCVLLMIAMLGFKLARKTPDVKSFLKIGILILLIVFIILWLENKFFRKDEADTADSEDESSEPTADPEPQDPTPPGDE
ncbi:MAG: hypothetical protein OSB47_09865, partial [Pirellulaceae bacterium]|nr:hypothetical protein [Pirellulaceae bacterium]